MTESARLDLAIAVESLIAAESVMKDDKPRRAEVLDLIGRLETLLADQAVEPRSQLRVVPITGPTATCSRCRERCRKIDLVRVQIADYPVRLVCVSCSDDLQIESVSRPAWMTTT